MTIDLEAYLRRIGYHGPREPTRAVLGALHRRHPAVIAYENLDPVLGRPVSLDLRDIEAKLVHGRRGGYCFEHNHVFRAALDAFGFAVTPLIARVVWMAAPDAPAARNHMLLRVDLGGEPWIADVGFGGHILSAPLRLLADVEQATADAVLRLLPVGAGFALQTRLPAGWVSMYRFTLEPAEPDDYAVANWFTSTFPAHLLTTNLLAERLTPAVRASLLNTRLTRRHADGRTEVVDLATPADLAQVLDTEFGVGVSEEEAEAVFAKVPKG
jgi:N-hydroxyarylamine O-acetyltransferase